MGSHGASANSWGKNHARIQDAHLEASGFSHLGEDSTPSEFHSGLPDHSKNWSWINIGSLIVVDDPRFSRRFSSATTCHGYRLSGAPREGHQTFGNATFMVRGVRYQWRQDLLKKWELFKKPILKKGGTLVNMVKIDGACEWNCVSAILSFWAWRVPQAMLL